MILLSQNDPRWKNIMLGNSRATIGSHGCTISVIGMKYGLTPDVVNERLNAVGGYVAPQNAPDQKNLVWWKKIEEAIPGAKFIWKYAEYDNSKVLENLPCIVEVDGRPIGGFRHWVLFIGNQMLYDPWDGQIKPTSAYQPVSFVVMQGEATELAKPSEPEALKDSGLYYKGLDLNNKDSMKTTVDIWNEVMIEKKWVKAEDCVKTKEEYEKKLLDANGALTAYNEMKALGYDSIEKINEVVKSKDAANLALQTEVSAVRDRNSKLADIVKKIEEEDHTTAELGHKAIEENKELQNTLIEVGKAAGVDKPTMTNIVSNIFRFKDLADKFIKKAQQEEDSKNPQPQTTVVKETNSVNWLLRLFSLIPTQKEVK